MLKWLERMDQRKIVLSLEVIAEENCGHKRF